MSKKNHLKTAAKIVVSVTILVYLLSWIPTKRVISIIYDLSITALVGMTLLLTLEVLISTASIYILANYYTDIDYIETFKLDSMNFIANTFIPTKLGSMISMPILFDRYTSATKGEGAVIQTTQLVLMTTITGITAGVGWLLFHGLLPERMSLVLAVSTILYVGFPMAIACGYALSGIQTVRNFLDERLPIETISQGVRIDSSRLLISAACVVITKVLIAGGRMWVLAAEFDVELGLIAILFVPALMYSVTVLPISLGGIGVAEASGTVVLTALGVPVDIAAAFVIIDRVFVMYLPVVGFYIYINISGLPTKFETTNQRDNI